jgi:hypothetical protein
MARRFIPFLWKAALLILLAPLSGVSAEPDGKATPENVAAVTAPVRKLIIEAVAAGKKPEVYLNVLGKSTRVPLAGADDKGLTISTMGNKLPIEWKRLSAEELAEVALACARSGADFLEVIRFCALHRMAERAEKAAPAALESDKSLASDIKTAMALFPKAEPPKPAQTPADKPVTPAKSVALIPDDRCIDWRPGIPGGIPAYPVFASVRNPPYNAKGDGLADDTHAIRKAIDDCPAGKAVLLPAGTYRLTGMLTLTKGIALRGEGPEKTKLINEATANHIIMLGSRESDSKTKILQGYTKGSSRLVVEDPGKFKAGDLVLIDQLNDPELVDIQGCGGACTWAGRESGKRAMGQLVRVMAKDGANLTLSRPLYFTFKESLQPEADRIDRPVVNAGVEDLYLEMKATKRKDDSSPIRIEHGIHCWVKNIESYKGWYAGHVSIQASLGCEIRDSYFHHTHAFGAGHGYGVWVFAQSTDTLVENNIFHYLNSGMMIESGGCGNVFGYNYSSRMFGRDYPNTDWAHSDISLHGAHPYMNLFEGNYVSTIGFDFYWGSASHNTIFRNYADMDCKMVNGQPMMAIIAVRLDMRNYFMNAIGNVFGHEGIKGVVEPQTSNYGQKTVWHLGYKTPSGGGAPDDPKTGQTLLRHANLDFISKQIQWDPAIASRTLPSSLYLSAKPAFFGNTPWPAIGPDVNPVYNSIPARDRFLKLPKAEQ